MTRHPVQQLPNSVYKSETAPRRCRPPAFTSSKKHSQIYAPNNLHTKAAKALDEGVHDPLKEPGDSERWRGFRS